MLTRQEQVPALKKGGPHCKDIVKTFRSEDLSVGNGALHVVEISGFENRSRVCGVSCDLR